MESALLQGLAALRVNVGETAFERSPDFMPGVLYNSHFVVHSYDTLECSGTSLRAVTESATQPYGTGQSGGTHEFSRGRRSRPTSTAT